MQIGDLVKDTTANSLGIIIKIGFRDDIDEAFIILQLLDGRQVLASYEDLERVPIPCSSRS